MRVRLDLTSPEHHDNSAMPKVLREMLYGDHPLLEMIEWTGCPNTGCEHKLIVSGERSEVVAWLDLLKESFPQISEEMNPIKRKIHLEFIKNPSSTLRVSLKEQTRLVNIEGDVVSKPWFWTKEWEKWND